MVKSNHRQHGFVLATNLVALMMAMITITVMFSIITMMVIKINHQKQLIYQVEKLFFATEEYYLVNCDSNDPSSPDNVINPTVSSLKTDGFLTENDKIINPFGNPFTINFDRSTGSTNIIIEATFNSERYFKGIKNKAEKYFGVAVNNKTVYFSRPLLFGKETEIAQDNSVFGGNICHK
ncbi:hypothetical protein [Photobacterium sp. GB-72]|uniref:hypothetical protein n=1 Tax=Photobacterium sp. GB-72 TaxID=2022105 RepID=UPI000D17D773|nr:hypothetical protein [Photobacterium sp. GB-72]PSV27669.1 hypothetical protein C9J40_20245 [Photobacterium sp. GB-72]